MPWTPTRPGRGGPPLELVVLEAVARDVDTVPALVAATGASPADVQRVLRWADDADLVVHVPTSGGPGYRLTEGGRGAVALGRATGGSAPASGAGVDVARVARKLGEVTQHARHGRDAVRERREAPVLLEPQAREHAVEWLNLQYVHGVLDDDDRDRRVGQALAARTRGELARAMSDLPQPTAPPRSQAITSAAHELTRTLLAIAAVVGSLVLAMGVLIVLVLVLRG